VAVATDKQNNASDAGHGAHQLLEYYFSEKPGRAGDQDPFAMELAKRTRLGSGRSLALIQVCHIPSV